jgi:hypothetical protein
MQIEIHEPKLEQRFMRQIQSGRFRDADELLGMALDALEKVTPTPTPELVALRRKNLVELCDPVRGLAEDIEPRR